MIKRLFTLSLFIAFAVCCAGCGGGSGSPIIPNGVDAGVPSVVKLMPVKQVAQTNSTIALTTKVLDGNGQPVPNVQVVYTNLATLGHLSSTTATTNANGQATVTVFSSDVGFATIQAEVAKGTQWVRDRKVVFFSPFDLTLPPGAARVVPTLTIDVDSNKNRIFNEPVDFILLDGPNNNQAILRATVKDDTGSPVSADTVAFSSGSPEVSFPLGRAPITDNNGQAETLIEVDPIILRDAQTVLPVWAISQKTQASNVVTFFLRPVTVGTLTVTANPTTVDSGGSSEITVVGKTSAGNALPDGTTINFTASRGVIDPFAQTTDGVARANWTAPDVTTNQSATITASVGGKSGSVAIQILAPPVPLQVIPTVGSFLTGVTPNPASQTFTISGGTGPYIVISNAPAMVLFGTSPTTTSTGSLTANFVAGACAGTGTITITDSKGATATITITAVASPLTVTPNALTCTAVAGSTCAGSPITVSGGVPFATGSYTVTAADPTLVTVTQATANTFNITRGLGLAATPKAVNVDVVDRCNTKTTATATVQ